MSGGDGRGRGCCGSVVEVVEESVGAAPAAGFVIDAIEPFFGPPEWDGLEVGDLEDRSVLILPNLS